MPISPSLGTSSQPLEKLDLGSRPTVGSCSFHELGPKLIVVWDTTRYKNRSSPCIDGLGRGGFAKYLLRF